MPYLCPVLAYTTNHYRVRLYQKNSKCDNGNEKKGPIITIKLLDEKFMI